MPLSKLSANEMGDLLGVNHNGLADLTRRGIVKKTARNEYDARESVRAYTAHLRNQVASRGTPTKNLTVERERLIREQADREALRNAQTRAELIPAADVERTWSETLSYVRAAMLALPARLQQSLGHLTAHDVATIDREIRDALTEIADDR